MSRLLLTDELLSRESEKVMCVFIKLEEESKYMKVQSGQNEPIKPP